MALAPKVQQIPAGGSFTLNTTTVVGCLRSLTLVVTPGATATLDLPDVGTPQGQAPAPLPPGSYTWAIDSSGDCLLKPIVVTASGGDAFLMWTEVV